MFQHCSTTQRDSLLGLTHAANHGIVFNSCQEGRHESADRVWRRWLGFCRQSGFGSDPYLTLLSVLERELLVKGFLQHYRSTTWDPAGHATGVRKLPLGGSTIRQAASHLGAAFRQHFRDSPLHVQGSSHLRPFARALLKSFENIDAPKRQQRAVTPKLLRAMFELSGASVPITRDTATAVIAEHAIVAYFFAMRSCEITHTATPGRTKIIRLRGVLFRDAQHREIPHDDPTGLALAERVTITFEDQKNGLRMDRRTHQRTADPVLCPVRRLASLIERMYRRVPRTNRDSAINTVFLSSRVSFITSDSLRKFMRSTCSLLGGETTFGFHATDIGTKSLRSGAAMSLFLTGHSVHKIMILGRWSSDAFLVYIRPQVLEWTDNMSHDMIRHNSFLDATDSRRTTTADPRTRERKFNADKSFVPIRLMVHQDC